MMDINIPHLNENKPLALAMPLRLAHISIGLIKICY